MLLTYRQYLALRMRVAVTLTVIMCTQTWPNRHQQVLSPTHTHSQTSAGIVSYTHAHTHRRQQVLSPTHTHLQTSAGIITYTHAHTHRRQQVIVTYTHALTDVSR